MTQLWLAGFFKITRSFAEEFPLDEGNNYRCGLQQSNSENAKCLQHHIVRKECSDMSRISRFEATLRHADGILTPKIETTLVGFEINPGNALNTLPAITIVKKLFTI